MSTISIQVSDEDITKWEGVIQKFVRDNPGQPIPSTLLRWLFNMSNDKDVEVAMKRLKLTDPPVHGAALLTKAGLLEAAENGAELGTCDED